MDYFFFDDAEALGLVAAWEGADFLPDPWEAEGPGEDEEGPPELADDVVFFEAVELAGGPPRLVAASLPFLAVGGVAGASLAVGATLPLFAAGGVAGVSPPPGSLG